MKTRLGLVLLLLSLSGPAALAQVTCSVVGQTAVCVGPNGAPTVQQQLNPNTGVVIAAPDASVTPYTILTPNAPPLAPLPPLPHTTHFAGWTTGTGDAHAQREWVLMR